MKKLLIVLLILVLVCVAALTLFIALFDLDKYRPQVVEQLQEVLQRPVKLGKLSLAWRGGIAVDVDGVVIEENAPRSGSMIEVQRISAVVSLPPLVKKMVVLSSIDIVRPVIVVEKLPDGTYNLEKLIPPTSEELPSPEQAPTAPAEPSANNAGRTPLPFAIQRIRVADGVVRYSEPASNPPVQQTIDRIEAEAAITSRIIEVRSFSARIADGTVSGKMTVKDPAIAPIIAVKVAVDGLLLEKLLPPASQDAPSVRGRFSAVFDGTAQGMKTEEALRTLTGKGNATLEEGALVNFNVLREIFQKVPLPGVMETLLANLPPAYQEKFQSPDTLLKKTQVEASVSGGSLSFKDLNIETDAFDLNGSADVRLDGAINGKAVLRVERELSGAMIKSVKEFQYITDPKGRIELPAVFQGRSPSIQVTPDVNYLTQRLLTTNVQDLVGGLLERVFEKNSE